MLIAMAIAAVLCVFIGAYPDPMYALMPAVVDYNPYTTGHILWQLQLLPVTARFVRDAGSRLWQATLGALMDRMRWVMANLSRYHGPKGVLAGTWPTGSMVLWGGGDTGGIAADLLPVGRDRASAEASLFRNAQLTNLQPRRRSPSVGASLEAARISVIHRD